MDIGTQHVAECSVNALVALDQRQSGEFRGDDTDAKMAAAVAGAFMACVAVTFVLDVELLRRKRILQAGANALDAVAHGSTRRNGRTLTSR